MAEDQFERNETAAASSRDKEEIRIPLVAESVQVEKRLVDIGYVEIRKRVVTEQVMIPVELRREEIEIRRVDAEEGVETVDDPQGAFVGSTLRIPVLRERAVVQKAVVVIGEVVIDRTQVFELVDITESVRKERVQVDENYRRDRAALEEHFRNRAAGSTRTFDRAEPNYRLGYEAGYDERYRGREFEDVEPELRRSHTGADSWEHLREEIREGWTRARSR